MSTHRLTCWAMWHWRHWRYHLPRWRDDKTAKMLGIADKGCPRCGAGAATHAVGGVEQ
jgi:hypothetical protein